MSVDKEYEKAHIRRLDALERAFVRFDPDPGMPTEIRVCASMFEKLRTAATDATWYPRSAGTPMSGVSVVVDDSLPSNVVKMGGCADPRRDRYIDTDSGKRHSLAFCAGLDDATGCHDGAEYASCGSGFCSGQDEYVGDCGCSCHDD